MSLTVGLPTVEVTPHWRFEIEGISQLKNQEFSIDFGVREFYTMSLKMQGPYLEIWQVVEQSLDCVTKARQLISDAYLLREMSEGLRGKSQDLLRANHASRRAFQLQSELSQKPFMVENLQFGEDPPLS